MTYCNGFLNISDKYCSIEMHCMQHIMFNKGLAHRATVVTNGILNKVVRESVCAFCYLVIISETKKCRKLQAISTGSREEPREQNQEDSVCL